MEMIVRDRNQEKVNTQLIRQVTDCFGKRTAVAWSTLGGRRICSLCVCESLSLWVCLVLGTTVL